MKLFHNILDQFSRDYVDLYGAGKEIVDWYNNNEASAKSWLTNPANPSPSQFPAILLETPEEYTAFTTSETWASAIFSNSESPCFVYPTDTTFNPNL